VDELGRTIFIYGRQIMSKPFYEMTDTELAYSAGTFVGALEASPATYHVTADQVTAVETASNAFDDALAAWTDNATRTPVAMANKTAARETLLGLLAYLVNTINSNPATTDAQRDALGIRARKTPTPTPAPTTSPIIDVIATAGRIVTIGLHATEAGKRGKPSGVKGASVFTHVGATAPTDPAAWKFEGLITRTKFEISFEGSTAANTVWITANWYNEKGQTGPACSPVSINLPAATVLPLGENLKIAA
jgi:hypothetical protein